MRRNPYPVIPLKNIVVYPNIIIPIFVGRGRSLQSLLSVVKDNKKTKKEIIFVLQSSMSEEPTHRDLHKVGVIAELTSIKRLDDKVYKVLVNGFQRVTWKKLSDNKKFLVQRQ